MQSRKPYVPIDTCSPAGDWIEEKRYNRQRATSTTHARKVLCGNWQEEQILENDMLKMEQDEQELTNGDDNKEGVMMSTQGSMRSKGDDFSRTNYLKASLDVIKDKGNGVYAGGFNSTPYLISHENNYCSMIYNGVDGSFDNKNASITFNKTKSSNNKTISGKDMINTNITTTHRADFNAESSNVKSLQRPALGVRSQVLLNQLLQAAEKTIEQEDREKAAHMAELAASHVLPSRSVGGYGKLDALSNSYQSIYKVTMCNPEEELPVIDELHNDYLSDVPITLYTGNPQTNAVMLGVTGKTGAAAEGTGMEFAESSSSSSKSQFGRHTYFTDPKYNLEN